MSGTLDRRRTSLRNAVLLAEGAGLVNEPLACQCWLDRLEPCGGARSECQIGFRKPCSCGNWFLAPVPNSVETRYPVCRLEEV